MNSHSIYQSLGSKVLLCYSKIISHDPSTCPAWVLKMTQQMKSNSSRSHDLAMMGFVHPSFSFRSSSLPLFAPTHPSPQPTPDLKSTPDQETPPIGSPLIPPGKTLVQLAYWSFFQKRVRYHSTRCSLVCMWISQGELLQSRFGFRSGVLKRSLKMMKQLVPEPQTEV